MFDRPQMDSATTSNAEQTNRCQAQEIIYVLNFQDKKSMSITENQTNTLLAKEAKNQPAVFMLKIRGGREVDSKGKKAGKGPLIQTNISATIGTTQDQYLFQPKVEK